MSLAQSAKSKPKVLALPRGGADLLVSVPSNGRVEVRKNVVADVGLFAHRPNEGSSLPECLGRFVAVTPMVRDDPAIQEDPRLDMGMRLGHRRGECLGFGQRHFGFIETSDRHQVFCEEQAGAGSFRGKRLEAVQTIDDLTAHGDRFSEPALTDVRIRQMVQGLVELDCLHASADL